MTTEMQLERHPLVLCSEQELAGFITPGSYDQEQVGQLRSLHEVIIETAKPENPYTKYAETGAGLLFKRTLDTQTGLRLVAGPVGAFTKDQLAVFIQEQARNYVHRDTMGKEFPRGDESAEKDLLSLFVDGFKEDDVIIMVTSERTQDRIEIIGGAKIVRGTSSQLICDSAIKGDHPTSSLPTFAALQMKENFEEPQLDMVVAEKDTVCITRYWTQDKSTARQMGLTARVAPHIIAAMPIAYALDAAQNRGGVSAIPKRAIFDTHHRSIVSFVESTFKARIVAENGKLEATPDVMNTILRYHYGDQKAYGGYGEEIFVGMFDTETFLTNSFEYFRTMGIEF